MDPLVTVIVRSMARPTLDAALESIAAQDYPNVEVVVVAASGPTHPALAPRAGAHTVRLVRPDRPLLRPAAGNAGLAAAGGAWITFLDDDDLILADHLSGLVLAPARPPDAGVVHGIARAVLKDGRAARVGQPHARVELFDRNYLHLSSAIVDAALVRGGCRFDETLDILEDWDFFLQLAQRTTFHFVARETFVWHADRGTSGGGAGRNEDDARFVAFRDRVYAKWSPIHDAISARVTALLQDAQSAAQRGERAHAEERCRAALAVSQNDPWALNLLAMIRRTAGDIAGALAAQRLAVSVRPDDASFAHNLALLYASQRDHAQALRWADRALALDAAFVPAARLRAQLRGTQSGP